MAPSPTDPPTFPAWRWGWSRRAPGWNDRAVIGESWFPIAIRAATESTRIDWRSDPSALTYEFVPVPDNVADVMLEANSGPQFGWLEAATGAPMVAALAELLMKGGAVAGADNFAPRPATTHV